MLQGLKWEIAEDVCIHCGQSDFEPCFGARSLVLCVCCQTRGTHKECEEKGKNIIIDEAELASLQWFCSEVRV